MLGIFKRAKEALSVEQWAEANCRKASAEGIIAAAIVQSFAKDLSVWENENFNDAEIAYRRGTGSLKYPEKNITLTRKAEYKFNPYGPDFYRFNGMTVNDISMTKEAEKYILRNYESLAIKLRKAEETAERVKAEIDHTERAWNLAETLLGFKRNEQGALVPQVKI